MSRLRLEITSVFATAGRRQIFKEGIRGRLFDRKLVYQLSCSYESDNRDR
jgi:hypothetical protein